MGIYNFHCINDVCLQTIVFRFLLGSLNINAILGEETISRRRKKLEVMARAVLLGIHAVRLRGRL